MTRDAEARARIENDLDRSFLVEAAAGTGKTTALVGRIVRLLATGRAEITQIAAITFTERAAGELVLRLRERLELARQATTDVRERALLERALGDFEAAYVGTIHGFCAELLRARPLDAGVDPAFVLLETDEQMALVDETTDRFLEDALRDPPEGLRRALARLRSDDRDADPPRAALAKEIRELIEHRDQDPHLVRAPFDRDAAIDALVSRADVARWLARSLEVERTRPRDHDHLERELVLLARGRNTPVPKKGPVRVALDELATKADADLAFCLARDLAPAVQRYEARKRALGVLDHLDSLLRARTMLTTSRAARIALRDRFRFLFVDEVQDVDPIQKDIVLLLAGTEPEEDDPAHVRVRPGSLYLVGDPKQAIYGFRRADLRTYFALARALTPHAERLELSASHRPRPAIAALVNAAFADEFDGSPVQAGHVALEAQRPAMDDFPSVIALPAPRSRSAHGNVTRGAVEGSLPDAIACFVHWLLGESGLRVEDPITRQTVPIAARHVAILFRTLKTRGTEQARSLERYGVPHSFVGPDAFFEREVIVAASALVSAIEWPSDALAVYATLRGVFLGIPDADLLAYRHRVGPLDPLASIPADGLSDELRVIHEALALLGALHRERHVRAIESTLGFFVERCEVDVLLLLTERRAEARALDQLRHLARRADRRGMNFRDLARWLSDRVDDPSLGGGELGGEVEPIDAVSLLTVHAAKGLERPVIVLGDPTSRPQRYQRNASRYTDPDRSAVLREVAGFAPQELRAQYAMADAMERAESMRLLYVAATRARDVLVVPTVGAGEIDDSWMAPLARALVPAPDRASSTLPRLPTFGDRSVLDDGAPAGVRPGHHATHLAGVTWWDPQLLLAAPPPRTQHGLTHLIERDRARGSAPTDDALDTERERVIRDAALGALEVTSARRLARTPMGATFDAASVVDIDLGEAGAEGARFTRLLTRLVVERAPERLLAEAFARELAATEVEVEAALAAVARFRADATIAALVSSPEARADVPYLLATDAGPVTWGRVGWVAPHGDGLAVVGLATDASEAARIELAIAAAAVARARERSVRAFLARFR
jgi:ATP-dependent exoDNAse (exonuclease V) beta subunit